ncbi:DUF2914 domain-containing protein [Candidatus Nomurabacteria bacterium]|nr:DUF2914 domain-containing protein [Candidatus Kaiserbacteria bacterium]MCB9814366.1 DUF2914 domain-containing protein [Candidatus Nomurabacteria bacterium]
MSIVKTIYKHIKNHWLTFGFVLGFITDNILLNRIDNLFDNLVLLFYAILATVSILLLYVGVADRGPEFLARFLKRYAPILMQYAFGGLLSGMLIFYGRSGDWLASAPFLLMIVAVVLGNELVAKRSDKLLFHIALYFVGLFSYVVLVLPVLLGRMGDEIFVLSSLISLMIVTFVVQTLYKIIPNFMQLNTTRIIISIGSIFVTLNFLYFTNIIPPIPLSLTELEIVQSVDRQANGNYRVEFETQPWYRQIPFLWPVIHPKYDTVDCFARVYAPTRLSTEIFHRWEYKNANGDWEQQFRFGYKISGANEGGYRGYTSLENYRSGLWRCTVETKRGQVLGREIVEIDTKGQPQPFQVRID